MVHLIVTTRIKPPCFSRESKRAGEWGSRGGEERKTGGGEDGRRGRGEDERNRAIKDLMTVQTVLRRKLEFAMFEIMRKKIDDGLQGYHNE